MSSYTITNPALNPKRVFILQKSELEKRWDPNTYHFERRSIIDALKKSSHKLEPLKFVSSFKKNIVKEIPENLPYLGLENIESNTGSYIATSDKESISSAIEFKKGQVLFPKLRPYLNKVYFAEFDGVCSTEFHVLNSNKVSNEYLANFLRTNLVVNQTKYLMSGNTLPRLQTDDIESLLIPILSNENEEKVNNIMRSVFLQKQINEAEAEKLLASIDDYLLGELGITLPTPPENTLKNRMFIANSKDILGCRFDPFYHQKYFREVENVIKASEFREDILRNQLSFIESGSRPKGGASKDEKGILSLGGEHVNNFCEVQVRTAKYIPLEFHQNILLTETKLNDILFVKDGATTGKVGMINKAEYVGQNINEHVFLLRPINEINAFYLVNYLNSNFVQIVIKKLIAGATVTGITKDALKSLPIPVPPFAKQKEIAEHITNIRNQAQALKDKTKDLLKKASEEIEEILLN
jgi:restriction endonuclease S subunit